MACSAPVEVGQAILYNRGGEMFIEFFTVRQLRARCVHGCQMMSRLKCDSWGSHWPRFDNASEHYEGRLVQVQVTPSASLFLTGMAGSVVPIANAHGEGRAVFATRAQLRACFAMRYVDSEHHPTDVYPYNPNAHLPQCASPRMTVGHSCDASPERFRTVQMSWHLLA